MRWRHRPSSAGPSLRELLSALRFQFLVRAVARVGQPSLYEGVEGLAVEVETFGLAVGGVGAADVGAFVEVDAQPPEGSEDVFQVLLAGAVAVRVVDAEDHLSAAPAGEEPVKERGPHAADVQRTGR